MASGGRAHASVLRRGAGAIRIDLTADVYPYTYWHSTIRVIIPDRDFFNPAKVAAAITDNGGPTAIRVVRYAPEAALAG